MVAGSLAGKITIEIGLESTIRDVLIPMDSFFPLGRRPEGRLPGQSIRRQGKPRVDYVDPDAPEMVTAIQSARSSVVEFIRALNNPKPAQSSFAVKVAFCDRDHEEHMWIVPVQLQDGRFVGCISNEPDKVSTVKLGDEVSVAEDQVSDWMYVDNGRLVGGFTIRALRNSMSEEEGCEFDGYIPFIITDHLHSDDPLVQLFDSIGHAESETLSALVTGHPDFANRPGQVAVRLPLRGMELQFQYPLKYAVCLGNSKAVEILLQHKADPNCRDNYESTPLHDAARHGHGDLIRILVKYGADVNARNEIGLTPLKTAVINDYCDCIELLLAFGADVRLRLIETKDGVLHNLRSEAAAKLLLHAGAKLDELNDEGESALHHALLNGFVDLAIYLIEQGANANLKNNEGETPLDVARNSLENDELERVLTALRKMER